ncbi:hypothetical protein HORIV_20840 [Vreelandella olivaria]|uniref:Uncharacterized protein n=1 Tax=Vreelandella olivaria TaxID=390919 RepID=A0ABN5WXN7_9GAMM|nr:hypothetical protein HORIV_20840 [Halomonas olivaria]
MFALQLFAGLIVHGILAEVLTRSPSLILTNTNYVKKWCSRWKSYPWCPLAQRFSMPPLAPWC